VKETTFNRMGPLVESAVEAVSSLLDRPYAIFGQSLGALVGFELGRALTERRYPPAHLFVSACSAPHLHAPHPAIHALPDAEFLTALERFVGTPPEVLQHEELMRQLMPGLRADFAVSETYHYSEGPLHRPITAFGALEDRIVPAESLAGWRQHTLAGFNQVMYPGGHFYLQDSRAALLQRMVLELGLD
jgi:medium-chain acyl-[acyl-carrier-protein] hydrolase